MTPEEMDQAELIVSRARIVRLEAEVARGEQYALQLEKAVHSRFEHGQMFMRDSIVRLLIDGASRETNDAGRRLLFPYAELVGNSEVKPLEGFLPRRPETKES